MLVKLNINYGMNFQEYVKLIALKNSELQQNSDLREFE